MGIFLAGMAGLVTALAVTDLAVFIAASVVAGAGQGIAVSATIRGLLHGITLTDRAPIFAAVYLLSYRGAAIPSLISGQLSSTLSLFQIALGYGTLALLSSITTLLTARNPE
jgi:hypothetical protein